MCSVWIKIHSFSRYFSGLVYILQKRRTVFQKQKFTILPICQSAQLQVNDCKHFQEIGSNSLLCILSNYNLLLHCIFIQINQKKVQGQGEGDMKHKTKMSCLQFTLTFIYSTFCGKKRRGLFPPSHRHNTFIPSNVLFCGVRLLVVVCICIGFYLLCGGCGVERTARNGLICAEKR